MSRAVLWVVPAVAVIAVLLVGTDASGAANTAAVLVGVVAGIGLSVYDAARVRRLARRLSRWVGDEHDGPIELTGGEHWRELGTAVNTLGAQLRTTTDELRSIVPWPERLVTTLEEPAFVFGPDGRLVAANASAIVRFGLPPLDGPGGRPTALSALGSAAAAGAVEEAADTARMVTVDDHRGDRDLRVTASPLDEHVLVVTSDRTRERQVEELRRDFVTNASHELKTPVAAIAALTEALAVAPADRREALTERLGEESARLSRLVHDLLDLRTVDEDHVAERRAVDLVALVRAAVEEHRAGAAQADVAITATLPDHAVVAGVERELRLVVDNLVANAVQYNTEGGTVTVAVQHDGGDQVLTVTDTGVGIPQAAIHRVFERFYRVDVARSRERGGTGLGLSIVRNAVERHRGSVAVDSLLGSGTTVTVRLPVGQPDR